jgi:carbonic anhydrase
MSIFQNLTTSFFRLFSLFWIDIEKYKITKYNQYYNVISSKHQFIIKIYYILGLYMPIQYYQSPIELNRRDSIKIHQYFDIHGINNGAIYDSSANIFQVQDNIVLKINNKCYQLEEYHFHIPSEHIVNNHIFPCELHYVFYELDDNKNQNRVTCRDICGCNDNNDDNMLVIGRVICDSILSENLENIKVKIPSCYYEYDGTLTTGDYSPVRWIVGEKPLYYSFEEIKLVAKPARPTQPQDGRIIMFEDKN